MTKKTVLLIEDNVDYIELFRLTFEKNDFLQNFNLVTVRTGLEASHYLFDRDPLDDNTAYFERNYSIETEEKIKDRKRLIPNLILLDLHLPQISGLEILQKIRNDSEIKFLPVVIMSASEQSQDLVNSYAFGCNSYINKPVNFNELQTIIKQIILYWLTINQVPSNSGVLDV
jgi:two-component system, response regulator